MSRTEKEESSISGTDIARIKYVRNKIRKDHLCQEHN